MNEDRSAWSPAVTTIRCASFPAHGLHERYRRQPWQPYVIDGDTLASIRAANAIIDRQRRDDMLMEYLDDYGDDWADDYS